MFIFLGLLIIIFVCYVSDYCIKFKGPINKTRPTIVVLCGSTKFREAFEIAMRNESLAGHICIGVGLFGHFEGMDMESDIKKNLNKLHFAKIDLADEVLVLNVGGYIGESTRNEIVYANKLGKQIRYLETL